MDCCACWTVFALILFLITLWYNFRPTGSVSADGKSVLITGCDSGFGNLLAHRLLSMRFHVFALCLDDASPAAQKLRSSGADVLTCDVTSDDDVERCRLAVAKCLPKKGLKLWAIVNNAGISLWNSIELMPLEDFRKIYDVNAFAMIRVLKAFLPFVRRSRGRVINTASTAGRMSIAQLAAYSMSKHAVVALSDSLRAEMRVFGVRVSIIQPGGYATPIVNCQLWENSMRRMFNETREEVRNDYGKSFLEATIKYLKLAIHKNLRTNVNEVIDCEVHAITSLEPRDFYDCHWSTSLARIMFRLVPSKMIDSYVIKTYTGNHPVAYMQASTD